jgi:hypothetical protein
MTRIPSIREVGHRGYHWAGEEPELEIGVSTNAAALYPETIHNDSKAEHLHVFRAAKGEVFRKKQINNVTSTHLISHVSEVSYDNVPSVGSKT